VLRYEISRKLHHALVFVSNNKFSVHQMRGSGAQAALDLPLPLQTVVSRKQHTVNFFI